MALAGLRACLDPITPEIKRRLSQTADEAQSILIRDWLVAQCESEFELADSARLDPLVDFSSGVALNELDATYREELVRAGQTLARAKDQVVDRSGDPAAQEAVIAEAREAVRGLFGFALVEAEFDRWGADPTNLNLSDSEVNAHIARFRTAIESIRTRADRRQQTFVASIVNAYGAVDIAATPEVDDLSLDWSEAELRLYVGQARAAPVIADFQSLSLAERVNAFSTLAAEGRRLLEARDRFIDQFIAVVHSAESVDAFQASVPGLVPAALELCGPVSTLLQPELLRWEADPLNPYPLWVGALPVSAAACLATLTTCVNEINEHERIDRIRNQHSISIKKRNRLQHCWGPLMSLARLIITSPVSAATPMEFEEFQLLTRRFLKYPLDLAVAVLQFRAAPSQEHLRRLQAMDGAAEFLTHGVLTRLQEDIE